MVFDPFAGGTGQNKAGWPGYVTDDFGRFCKVFWANKSAVVVIDEAGDVFRKYRDDALPLLTKGRHIDPQRGGGGHTVFMLSQRFVGFDKTAREQATHGYIFRVGRSDARELADHWGNDLLAEAYRLPKLHYFAVDTLGSCKLGVLRF